MSEEITRNRLAVNANDRIRNRCNQSINWGTNSYPANSNAAWFAGPTSGVSTQLSAGNFAGGSVSVDAVLNRIRTFANLFGGIRRVRIRIYRSHHELGNELISDQTGIANTNYNLPVGTQALVTRIQSNSEMNLANLNAALDEIYSSYVTRCRETTQLLDRTICHTSCHSSCHSSRGRR